MNIIGIDNGVSGSIAILEEHQEAVFLKTPVNTHLSYTKVKQNISRINTDLLSDILDLDNSEHTFVFLERPMINPARFKASISAARALEATLITLEDLKLPYQYIDSKEWQKVLLPKGLHKEELKIASLDVGKRLFPTIDFKGFKDADGLLIAEYGRRLKNGEIK